MSKAALVDVASCFNMLQRALTVCEGWSDQLSAVWSWPRPNAPEGPNLFRLYAVNLPYLAQLVHTQILRACKIRAAIGRANLAHMVTK